MKPVLTIEITREPLWVFSGCLAPEGRKCERFYTEKFHRGLFKKNVFLHPPEESHYIAQAAVTICNYLLLLNYSSVKTGYIVSV